ncbi:hypothetical protein [Caulobacter sp. S45]|uniref:hypothetical protein n=1 Tax=Caulobacter sp. S45 TaxID=1641861 RepID=UPI00131B8D20|nr:hypothetical protein [Caulobacter sp. S45]
MSVEIADYINVAARANELGCKVPVGIAVMPDNFATATSRAKLLIQGEGSTLKTLLRNDGLAVSDLLPDGERFSFIHNKSHDWQALLFIAASLWSNDRTAVSVALSVVSNYLTDYFRGAPSHQIRLGVVVEKTPDRTYKQITYEGSVAGLAALDEAIRRVCDE